MEQLEIQYRRDERIIRFLTVKLDKYGVDYLERKRSRKEESTKEKEA